MSRGVERKFHFSLFWNIDQRNFCTKKSISFPERTTGLRSLWQRASWCRQKSYRATPKAHWSTLFSEFSPPSLNFQVIIPVLSPHCIPLFFHIKKKFFFDQTCPMMPKTSTVPTDVTFRKNSTATHGWKIKNLKKMFFSHEKYKHGMEDLECGMEDLECGWKTWSVEWKIWSGKRDFYEETIEEGILYSRIFPSRQQVTKWSGYWHTFNTGTSSHPVNSMVKLFAPFATGFRWKQEPSAVPTITPSSKPTMLNRLPRLSRHVVSGWSARRQSK